MFSRISGSGIDPSPAGHSIVGNDIEPICGRIVARRHFLRLQLFQSPGTEFLGRCQRSLSYGGGHTVGFRVEHPRRSGR